MAWHRGSIHASHPDVVGLILNIPNFIQSKNSMLLRFINSGTTLRVGSSKSLIVDWIHLVLVCGKLVLQKTSESLSQIQPKYFYKLLCSLSENRKDILHVMELVRMKKPLVALDFCYQGDPENISVLECMSLCVLVAHSTGFVIKNRSQYTSH